ncbi:DUF3821 domain-containing protein [uncultured Methanoregula sp.]|uniref:DUF3821 domain-containing protein n=1 Tax=uncultured Methanoregula sp. TaxID=1005933 RepID=UPI002AAB2E21|nr:DUF3821 domain-containing protein [uncultured Methanoregula sp.]
MQIPYILTVFVVLFLIVSPVSASLNKISANSPVFIGEADVDISAALNGCHTISWYNSGADINSATPAKSTQIYPINTVTTLIYNYNFTRDFYGGYTGTWYCTDLAPYYPVFVVEEPQLDIKVWDLDHNVDVTGKSIPKATNITYRIDTNLYKALVLKNRPNRNLDDTPFTVKLINPNELPVPGIYTGTMGKPGTQILSFDSKPYFTDSPYYWRDGGEWDHNARDLQGTTVYPDGTYSFVVSQNLNHMQDDYVTRSAAEREGKTTKTALVAFEKQPFVATVTEPPVTTAVTLSTQVSTQQPTESGTSLPTLPTSTPVPKKTTYSPIPEWLGIAGLVIAGIFIIRKQA